MQQGAAPAQAELRSRAEALWILLNRSGMTSNKGVDLIMERLSPDAHTPEYVSGWLAGREAAAACVVERWRLEQAVWLAAEIRAIAPPSAPPVQQIEARVQELLRVIHEEHADPSGCNCVYCEEYRRGRSERLDAVTICGAPAKLEDRMLLLKALLRGGAALLNRLEPYGQVIATWGREWDVTPDAEGFPILTDELRSALTKATHG